MNTWDISASLVRFVVLAVAATSILILRRWIGGRWNAYIAILGGVLSLAAAEGIHLVRLSMQVNLAAETIAWDSVYIHALGYFVICLGISLWVHDLHKTKVDLERNNLILKEAASTDFLTQLLSRRFAAMHLAREIARAQRNRTPLGFVMMDLDHFKQINDAQGHPAGDAVLAHVGKLLRTRVRESDLVVRYGGEEFLLVLPETDLDGSMKLANAVRLLLQENPTPCAGQALTVRASFGVVVADPGQHLTAKDLIARADTALYAAKAQGRNRVIAWAELMEGNCPPVPDDRTVCAPGA